MGTGSPLYAPLTGITGALEIQGGLRGLEELRTDAGVYLYHEIEDYLARVQTYNVAATLALVPAAGGDDITASTGQLRFGRYLLGLQLTAPNVTGLGAAAVSISNSNQQPDFPGMAENLVCSSTDTVLAGTINFVRWNFAIALPLWMTPGSFLIWRHRTTAAAPGGITYTLAALWATTEALSENPIAGAVRTPSGPGRSRIKI